MWDTVCGQAVEAPGSMGSENKTIALGVVAQMEGIEAALAARPDLDEAEIRAEIQALIDGEVDRLACE